MRLPLSIFLLNLVLATLCIAEIIPKHSKKFTRFENCEYVPTAYTDGDSFKVKIGQDEFVLRLYYVDASESDERFPDRNEEQAQYFGITPAESVAAGKAAKEFVKQMLTGKKFTVFTRWASALGSSKLPRYYAVIEVDGHGLGESLVEHGLARLHGIKLNHPNGTKADDYIATLAALEKTAREKKIGAWATSNPELWNPVIEEAREIIESPRWMDRSLFAGLGAAVVGVFWGVSAFVRRRKAVVS